MIAKKFHRFISSYEFATYIGQFVCLVDISGFVSRAMDGIFSEVMRVLVDGI